ncbi:MAG TPA: tetratricopeptide repeat protein, partial [Sedimentisphaerales bacterium]|nr:tetratricopeptide repeat protein [Sedimentisphaerales bacterium]
ERFAGDLRTENAIGRSRRAILEKLPLLVLATISSVVTILAQEPALASLEQMDIASRLTNALVSYGRYILQMIWPLRLAVHYPHADEPQYVWASVMGVLLLFVTFLSFRYGRRSKYLPVGWLWYLITLLPVIGILQVGGQSHADRYTYIPLTGIVLILGFGTAEWLDRHPAFRRAAAAVAVCILLAASALTWRQLGFWKDSITLYTWTAQVTRNNSRILTNHAIVLMEMDRLDEAMLKLQEAVTVAPHDTMAIGAMGSALLRQGRLQEALIWNARAFSMAAPNNKVASAALGANLVRLRRFQEAEPLLRKALEIDNRFADAWAQLAIVLQHTGRLDEAVQASTTALDIEPDLATGHLALAGALLRKGDFAAAAEAYMKTVQLAPDPAAWFNLAGCLAKTGRLVEAENAYKEALRLNPELAVAHYQLAVLMLESGRIDEARARLEEVLRLDPDNDQARILLDETERRN